MFDLLHLLLTFVVGFLIAYYLFAFKKRNATPPTTTTATGTPAPPSPLPQPDPAHATSLPRIDISPSSPSSRPRTGSTTAAAKDDTGTAPHETEANHQPAPPQSPREGASEEERPRVAASPSKPQQPTTPTTARKTAKQQRTDEPASPVQLGTSPAGDGPVLGAARAVESGMEVPRARPQSRSLSAIPKEPKEKTKSPLKKSAGSKTRSADRKQEATLKPSAASAITHDPTQKLPLALTDWRRAPGVSASHTVLPANRTDDFGTSGPSGAFHGASSASTSSRKIASSELPLHTEKKSGRPLEPARRIRSSSSNAKRVYPFQFDELSPDLAELKTAFAHPVTGVRTKTLTRKLTRKTYRNCFVGYDAVDWLLESVGGIDRKQAINLGVRMWASGFFKHVGSRRPFSDGPNHFYFVRDRSSRKKRLSLKGSRHARARRESVADLVMGEEKPIEEALKPREGWLDVKQGENWTKHWCLLTEMRHIKKQMKNRAETAESDTSDSDSDQDEKWSGWGLAIFEELLDKSLLDFVEELTAAGTGIPLKARRHYLKNYGRCFSGSKAVDWCVMKSKSASRPEAALLMTTLLQKGLISHVEKVPSFRDDKHEYYKFNIPVGPGGGKEGEKEKKKGEKKEKKEKKKEEKEKRKEERRKERDEPSYPYEAAQDHGASLAPAVRQSEGKTGTCPIAIVPLSDCLIKLEKSGSYVEIVLYRNDDNRVFLQNWKPDPKSDDSLSVSGRENRRSWRKGVFDDNASSFSIRIHRKDDSYVREWIYALEAAMLLGSIEKDGLTLDASVISDAEEDEEYDDGLEDEAGEVEMIEEEDEFESEEANTGDVRKEEEGEKPEPELESATEDESSEKQEELMDSTERIVLQEMRREIERMEQRKRAGIAESKGEADEIDFTTVPDGELLKFLRARRLVVADAITLMKSSVPYRRRNNLYNIKISDVMQEVGGCMLQLVEGSRDKEGRVVLLVQPQNYTPAASPPLNVVRAVMYLLDKAQEDVEVQRKGFTVLVDGTGSKYSNFDPKMPRVLLDGIISRYPARIGYTIITNMPWFFRFVWAVIRPLLSEKLAERFHIVTVDRVSEFIPRERLLPTYGGTLHYDHRAWIRLQHEREGVPFSS